MGLIAGYGWGGFLDGKLNEYTPGHFAIYKTKAEAQRHYEDVRRVEIKLMK